MRIAEAPSLAPADPLENLRTGSSEVFSRMHVIVVHSEAVMGFLATLFADESKQQGGS